MQILIGVTGSVAAVLTPKLVAALEALGHDVRVVLSASALYFITPQNISARCYLDIDEWPEEGYQKGDEVLHIELRNWADVLVIAPLSANTLSTLAHAGATNLLTSTVRAWDTTKPILVAPAMNTAMWEHPATKGQLEVLARWYDLTVVLPQVKLLACGDTGIGALAPIGDIVRAVHTHNMEKTNETNK